MNYIDSVEIEGFWGRKNISLKLHNDLNFLIGPNGSGKTTIINLIAAVLRADIPALYSLQFTKVSIQLTAIGSNRKPVIKVEKYIDQKMDRFKLNYTVRKKSGDKGKTYGIEGPYDERFYRDYRYNHFRRRIGENPRLGGILSDLVEVNLLPIHRASSEIERRVRKEEGPESSVDHKLHEISRDFSQFFSLLTSRAEKESKIFQEYVFVSLLDQKYTDDDVIKQVYNDAEKEDAVVDVLRDLGVPEKQARKSVNAHYTRVSEANEHYSQNSALNKNHAVTLSDAVRVAEMISQWHDLQHRRQKIFEPKEKFGKIINDLLSGKKIHFDDRNNTKVRLSSGNEFDIDVLSSGEKQLFILLGQALLQENRRVVFISDEPELSLHVRWQSSLFENIRSLNGACQIVSATHSPDIVGAFQDHIIDIESCISDV